MDLINPDYLFVIGLALAIYAVPAIVSAMIDGRAMRGGLMFLFLACAAVVVATVLRPGQYTFMGIPDVIIRVISDFT